MCIRFETVLSKWDENSHHLTSYVIVKAVGVLTLLWILPLV